VLGQVGPRMFSVDGVLIAPQEGAIFGVDMGQPIEPKGNLWRCCERKCEMIELLFGMVSGVGPRNEALDGVQIPRW